MSGALYWAPWALGALFYCFGFFHRVMPSVMISELMRDLGIGAAAVGTLAAFYFYAYASLQIVVGMIFDRFGARLPLAAACALAAAGTFLFAAAPNVETAYGARLAMGIGGAFTWVGTLKLIADNFPPARFAQMSGLTLFLGLMGAVFGQAPLAALVDLFGWRATAIGAGGFGAGLAVAIALVVRDRRLHETAAPVRAGEGLRSVLANPQSWILALYGGAITGPILAFGGLWGVPYVMTAYGIDRPHAATVATTMMIGWGLGGPLMGWLSDRMGKRRPLLLIGSIVALGALLAALYLPGLPLVIMQALLFVEGLASGTMVLIFAGAREHNRPGAASVAVGVVNTSGIGAAAILQPVVGKLLDLGWTGEVANGARIYPLEAYATACSALPAATALAIVAAVLIRETHCRNVHAPRA